MKPSEPFPPKDRSALDYFDHVAPLWGEKYARVGTFSERLSLVLAEIPERGAPTELALDAGCGTGELVGALAHRGFRAVGIDASHEMLRSAPWHFARARADVAHLPLQDSTCSVVTSVGVLEYLPDPLAAFSELARVLAPGGRIVVTVPNPDSVLRLIEQSVYQVTKLSGWRPRRLAHLNYLDHSKRVSVRALRRIATTAGLTEQRCRYFTPGWATALATRRVPMNLLLAFTKEAGSAWTTWANK
ncbi:MAG: class I SAM-dependent methyltransferase [Myxococcales bacterium]